MKIDYNPYPNFESSVTYSTEMVLEGMDDCLAKIAKAIVR